MSFDVICFDCDSTLSKIEGIDELAKRVGLGDELAELTNAAMNGDVALEDIYAKRLNLIKPSRADIEWLSTLYISELVDGVESVFRQLAQHNKSVHIISGGLLPAILPLAKILNVPQSHIHAVDIYFDNNGQYLGYDIASPLTKNGGKAVMIESLKSHNVVMIGDGQTDLEAQKVGAKVIGFGGVISRDTVRNKADFFVEECDFRKILTFNLI
ncbi:MAG: phosphoserine phosphatase [Pseudomonadota bacterium]|nr:phosphoserine phosphatase [Pseudomonadota bacterium]